jgi:hypothetical protein
MDTLLLASGDNTKYRLLKKLGQGGEGIVYLVQNKSTNEKYVMKAFHKPIIGTSMSGLRICAEKGCATALGLPEITLLGDADQIAGVLYQHIPLYEIHWRVLNSWEQVAQAMFGAYCRMQAHLISQCGIGLLDTVADHFLINRGGEFHYVDYGFMIKPIDHPGMVAQGMFGYGFAMLLMNIYHKNIKSVVGPIQEYDYSKPCIYCQSKELGEVAARHAWVREILSEVYASEASIFLEADFYQRLGDSLPRTVRHPELIISLSSALDALRKIRRLARL